VNKTGAPSDAALVAEVRGFQKRGREKTSQPGWEAGKQWISRFHVENYPQYDTVEKFIGWQEAGQEEWHFLGWQMDNDGTYLFQVTAKIPHESHGMVRLFSHTGRGIVVMGKVKDLEGETATWMSVGTPERVTPSLFRFPENLDGNDEVLEQGEKMRLLGHLLLGGWRMGPPLLLGVWGNNGKAVFGNLENHFMQVDPEAIGLQGPRPITRALASKIAQRQQFLRQVGAQGLGL
jgi:hypothetical protein